MINFIPTSPTGTIHGVVEIGTGPYIQQIMQTGYDLGLIGRLKNGFIGPKIETSDPDKLMDTAIRLAQQVTDLPYTPLQGIGIGERWTSNYLAGIAIREGGGFTPSEDHIDGHWVPGLNGPIFPFLH